jgi:hypothetical protein
LNWVAGDKGLVMMAAQVVLISTRIVEMVEEGQSLVKDTKRFWRILRGRHRLVERDVTVLVFRGGSLSHSTKVRASRFLFIAKIRVRSVAFCVVRISKRIFVLSMKTLDATSSFYYRPDQKQETLNEFFINYDKLTGVLINNKQFLVKCLKKNRDVIERVLINSHSILTADQLITGVKKSIDRVEKVNEAVDGVSKKVGTVGKDLFQRAAFGLLQSMGLAQYIPESMLPSMVPVWMKKKRHLGERFPPIDWVQEAKAPKTAEEAVRQEVKKVPVPIYGKGSLAYKISILKTKERVKEQWNGNS